MDRDGAQCGNADFTSIQAAVDAAQAGDVIRVCPDLYAETVTVDKPLTLTGDPDAIEAIDCLGPGSSQPGVADLTRQAIVELADDGFTVAFTLAADDIVLAGFVVQGASVGVDASDRFAGYRVHHNLIRLNTLFGMDFGSQGARESRVDHSCTRENRYGLVSELDDDSFAGDRGEGNARDLTNARIDHNLTFRNLAGLEAAGPGQRRHVTFDHNLSREDNVGIALQNSTQSTILYNEVTSAGFAAIWLGGGNDGVEIRSNTVRGGSTGLRFDQQNFIDKLPVPSRHVLVTENDVRRATAGVLAFENLADSLLAGNTTSENRGNGIILLTGNTGDLVRANHADDNAVAGISAFLGATGNRFEYNSMHGNGLFDARDPNTPLNEWINNDCLAGFRPG